MAFTYDQAMVALRKADAAGNVEDAKQLARIAQGLKAQRSSAPAPEETSFLGDLESGAKGLVNSANQTLGAFGITSGQPVFEQKGPTAGAQFANAGGEGFNWSKLPDAVVEATPGMAAIRAGQLAGGGIGALAGPPGAAAGAAIGGTLSGFMQAYGPMAYERARNNGRQEPTWGDLVAVAPAAVGSAVLDNFGAGKVGSGAVKDMLLRPLKEGATQAAQSALGQVGETLGTDKGLSVDPKQAFSDAIVGVGTGAVVSGVEHAPKAISEASRVATDVAGAPFRFARDKVLSKQFQGEFQDNPEQFASDARVKSAFDTEKAGIGAPDDPQMDSKIINNLKVRHKAAIKDVIDGLYDNREISARDHDALNNIYDIASTRNKEFNPELDASRILDMDSIDNPTKDLLIKSFYDLNTLSTDGMLKKRIGPIEELAKKLGSPTARAISGALGGSSFGLPGALAGATAGMVAPRIGRAVDSFMDNQEPPVLRGADIRAKVADKAGVDTSPVLRDLEAKGRDLYGNLGNVVALPKNYLMMRQRSQFYQEKAAAAQKARQLQRDHEALMEKNQKAVADMEAALAVENKGDDDASVHDPSVTASASRGVFQFRLSEAKKRIREAQEQAQSQAAEAQRLEDEAKTAEGDARKWDALTSGEHIALGGWKSSALEYANKNAPGLNIGIDDLKEALRQVVGEGHLTEDEAKAAWYVPGARLGNDPKFGQPYYKIQDKAVAIAAQRQGKSFGWEDTPELRQRALVQAAVDKAKRKASTDAQMELAQEQAAQQLPAMGSMILAKALTPAQLAALQGQYDTKKAKAQEAAKKAAVTRQAKASEPKAEPREPRAQENWDTVKSTAKELKEAALSDAPNGDLEAYARSIAGTKTKEGKKALYERALKEFPEHEQWIVSRLKALSEAGGTKS